MAISRKDMTLSVNGKVLREPKKEVTEGKFFWWKKKDDPVKMAFEIAATINQMQKFQNDRTELLAKGTRLYGQSGSITPYGPRIGKSVTGNGMVYSDRVSFNLCASVIDTIVSKTAKNKVVPTFITSGATWGTQDKAEKLSKLMDGMFYEQDVHIKGVYANRDAGMWGDGILYPHEGPDERVHVERVLPHELLVDQLECMVGDPRQIHRVKIVDRDVLKDMFKDDDEAIEAINSVEPASSEMLSGQGTAADLVVFTASWHLKSGEDADDGVYALCVGDKSLMVTEWDKPYFPFPKIQYNRRPFGYWGQGACERLAGLQLEINKLMILDQKSRHMMGSFKVLIENGSKIVSSHVNNEVATIIQYSGTPPQYITPPPIDPSNEAKLDSLIQKGFQQEGVSQLQASSLKPSGLDSAVGMRTYNDIADDRQLFMGQNMEKFYLELGMMMLDVMKDIYKRKGTYKVDAFSGSFLETIDWKDINLEKDEFVLKAFPTSELPDEPVAKLATVQEYAQAGWISPRAAQRLMSMPDVEMYDKLANASSNLIAKTIENILYRGELKVPDGNWDLQSCKQMAVQYYNYAVLNNCPEDRLSLLRQWQGLIDDGLGLNATSPDPSVGQDMGGTAAPQGGPPPANPAPPPVSQMIPNVNQGGAA